jgi:hypothetical protein
VRGERLGRRTLTLDAAYCLGAGAIAVVAARPLASLFGVPAALVAVLGIGAALWASVLLVLGRRAGWRRPVAIVACANLLAAICLAALAALAALAPGLAAQVLLAAVAPEVLAFAGVQAVALRRSR